MKKILNVLKKMLTENILLKLGSLVFAFLVWLAVVNVSDPNISRTIALIPIEVTETDSITDQNMIFNFNSAQTAEIVVSGKRSIISKLTRNDFTAKAPLSEMSQVYAVPVYVELKNNSYQNYVTINQRTHSITIEVEDLVTKSYDVEIKFEGEPFSGYVIGSTSLGRTSIDITAPVSKHNLISKVAVDVDVTDITTDISQRYDIHLYRADGTMIDEDDEIALSAKKTRVNVEILYTKEIPIKYELEGEIADGYEITDVSSSATTTKICGKEELVNSVSSIEIAANETNIEGISENLVIKVDLEDYLPDGVSIYDQDNRVFTINIEVEKLVIKTYKLDADNITLTNIPSKYKARILANEIEIQIKALEEYQDLFDVNDVKAVIDLSDATKGTGTYALKISLPDEYSLAQKVTARVRVYTYGNSSSETETTTKSTSQTENTSSETEETESESETEETTLEDEI